MGQKLHGSAAAGRRSSTRRQVPESAKSRASIRARLEPRVSHLQYLAAAVGYRLPAPDPESALVYLRALRDECDDILRRFPE